MKLKCNAHLISLDEVKNNFGAHNNFYFIYKVAQKKLLKEVVPLSREKIVSDCCNVEHNLLQTE